MARSFIGWTTVLVAGLVFVGCAVSQPMAAPARQDLTIAIPGGPQPTLDGTLGSDEWAGARQEELGGGELFLIQADGYLFLGIRGRPAPVASVFVDRGDAVAVFHSSAALGTAVYQELANAWEMVQPFSWSCRDTTSSARAAAARDEFLEQEGWLASNGRMGTSEEVEFQISIPDGVLRLAVSAIGAPNYDHVTVWPAGLEDDCVNVHLLTGPIPEEVQFSPGRWATLGFPPKN